MTIHILITPTDSDVSTYKKWIEKSVGAAQHSLIYVQEIADPIMDKMTDDFNKSKQILDDTSCRAFNQLAEDLMDKISKYSADQQIIVVMDLEYVHAMVMSQLLVQLHTDKVHQYSIGAMSLSSGPYESAIHVTHRCQFGIYDSFASAGEYLRQNMIAKIGCIAPALSDEGIDVSMTMLQSPPDGELVDTSAVPLDRTHPAPINRQVH